MRHRVIIYALGALAGAAVAGTFYFAWAESLDAPIYWKVLSIALGALSGVFWGDAIARFQQHP